MPRKGVEDELSMEETRKKRSVPHTLNKHDPPLVIK
jgi:hypothetical protein